MCEWIQDVAHRMLKSKCGRFHITNDGKKGGARYCLWGSVNMNLQMATGKKRKPFREINLDVHCRLLKMGTFKQCKAYAENQS